MLQRCLLLPQAVSQLADPLVHGCHLQVPLVQAVSLLLQLGVLILVQFVAQLHRKHRTHRGWETGGMENTG